MRLPIDFHLLFSPSRQNKASPSEGSLFSALFHRLRFSTDVLCEWLCFYLMTNFSAPEVRLGLRGVGEELSQLQKNKEKVTWPSLHCHRLKPEALPTIQNLQHIKLISKFTAHWNWYMSLDAVVILKTVGKIWQFLNKCEKVYFHNLLLCFFCLGNNYFYNQGPIAEKKTLRVQSLISEI